MAIATMMLSDESRQGLLTRWHALLEELNTADVTLLAVSKYAPDEAVQVLIDAGQRCFGESRAQNLRDRATRWPDCQWHMIGPMQRNKAKYIARHAAMWHSCDDLAIAAAVASHLNGRSLSVLIQVNIAENPEQGGVHPDALPAFAADLSAMDGLELRGLMAMAPQDNGIEQAFLHLRRLRDQLFDGSIGLLSMGMSNDYRIAVAAGSDMVRVGSTLFGDLDIRNNRNEHA